MTKEEFQEAAQSIYNAEKDIVIALDDAVKDFEAAINEITKNLPTNPSLRTPVCDLVLRMKSSVLQSVNYELTNAKNQYGLVAVTPIP